MSHGQHGQQWKFTSFSIQKMARPSGTTLQLACEFAQVPSLSMQVATTPHFPTTNFLISPQMYTKKLYFIQQILFQQQIMFCNGMVILRSGNKTFSSCKNAVP